MGRIQMIQRYKVVDEVSARAQSVRRGYNNSISPGISLMFLRVSFLSLLAVSKLLLLLHERKGAHTNNFFFPKSDLCLVAIAIKIEGVGTIYQEQGRDN